MQQKQFSSSNVLFGLAILLGVSCLLASAQMTFSDGWGKRSAAGASPFALLQHGGSKRQSAEFGGVGRGIVGELSMGGQFSNSNDNP